MSIMSKTRISILKYTRKVFYFPMKCWQSGWCLVWNLSELTGVGLGQCAPWVFAQMTGIEKYERIK